MSILWVLVLIFFVAPTVLGLLWGFVVLLCFPVWALLTGRKESRSHRT